MLVSRRILQSPNRHLPPVNFKSPADSSAPLAVDSDIVVILAALLCALICVVGLALAARCTWIRRSSSYFSSSSPDVQPPHPDKGVKKKVLRSLPKLSFHQGAADATELADCPICLAEFVEGDEIRVLPQCGHGFHVDCIDRWLGSHSSCPSCRQILPVSPSGAASLAPGVTARCERCGVSSPTASADEESGANAREDGDGNWFLP